MDEKNQTKKKNGQQIPASSSINGHPPSKGFFFFFSLEPPIPGPHPARTNDVARTKKKWLFIDHPWPHLKVLDIAPLFLFTRSIDERFHSFRAEITFLSKSSYLESIGSRMKEDL